MEMIPKNVDAILNCVQCRQRLIAAHGKSGITLYGANASQEHVLVKVTKTGIKAKTFQRDGKIRVSRYDENGSHVADTFEGEYIPLS